MAKYEISAPDGSKWEVTAPEGANEEQVLEYAKSQWQQKPTDAQSAPKRQAQSLGPAMSFNAQAEPGSITSRLDFYKNSALRGVENLLGFGPSVADFLTGAGSRRSVLEQTDLWKTGTNQVPTLTEGLQQGFRGVTGMNPEMQAPDTLTRYGGKALEFAITALPFGVRTVANAAHRLPAAMAEVGSAALGGVGFELGGDVGENLGGETGKSVGQLVGSVGGSIAGLATPVTFSKIWSMASPRLSQSGRDAAIKSIAGKKLAASIDANPQSGANMLNAEDVIDVLQQKGVGTFKPTLGQMTGAEGVRSIEQNIATSTPGDLGLYSQRANENRAVIDAAKNLDFPQGGNFQRAAGSTVRNTIKALDDRLDNIVAQQERLAQGVTGSAQQAAGERLKVLRDAAQQAARGARDARLRDVYDTANRLGVSENMDDAVAIVRKLGGDDKNTFQNMPPVFKKVMDEYAAKEPTGRYIPPDLMQAAGMKPKNASFEEVHSLWRETNSQLATAKRVGDQNAEYYLNQLKDTLKKKLDRYEQDGMGELSDKFKDFNKWFSTKYAPAFYEGVGGRMSATTRFGEVVKPEEVTKKFFSPSGIDDFNLIYGGNKDAQNTLRDGILGMFSEKAIRDGKINQSLAKAFLRENAEALNKLPDVKATLSNASAVNEALFQRAERLTSAKSSVAKSIVAKLANTEDPTAFVQKALTDRRSMMALISSAKDPASRDAVLRAVADNIPEAALKANVDPLTFISQNEQALRPALNRLGPQHYDNLRILANAETIMGRTNVPTHAITPKMTAAIEDITGSSPRTIWAQTANAAAGRQSETSAVLHLLSRFGIRAAEKETDKILRAVIYDPSLAQELVRSSGQRVTSSQSNNVIEHLRNAGVRVFLTNNE